MLYLQVRFQVILRVYCGCSAEHEWKYAKLYRTQSEMQCISGISWGESGSMYTVLTKMLIFGKSIMWQKWYADKKKEKKSGKVNILITLIARITYILLNSLLEQICIFSFLFLLLTIVWLQLTTPKRFNSPLNKKLFCNNWGQDATFSNWP